MTDDACSRRAVLARTLLTGLASAGTKPFSLLGAPAKKPLPIGLEMYSVREELAKDLNGTIRAVAAIGYSVVEFFGPYRNWTPAQAKDVRKLMDDLKLLCLSTHNAAEAFTPAGLARTIELNNILGARYCILALHETLPTVEAYKREIGGLLTTAGADLNRHGLHAGFHNHEGEWKPIQGTLPMEVIAQNTPADVALQLDVGTCLKTGNDPIAWIQKHPGRTRSVHLKEWTPQHGYRAVFGDDGTTPWARLLAAAEGVGGAEYYLLEQEESDFPPMEAVKRGLAAYRKVQR